ncbi:hypothetical protein M569_01159, partial [Genlisea aurea]
MRIAMGASSTTKARAELRNREDIVIVGAGIAGLATAVALHRLGIRSVVLEQAQSLRAGGTSVTFFKNGWKALDAIGVGSELRDQFLEIQGMTVKSEDGRELRSFNIKDEDESQEVRAVERRILLETLASRLPPDTISFSSKVKTVKEADEEGVTLLELEDSSQISAKIVIACDGIRSPVAKWMGFADARYVGYSAIRGLACFPDGQFQPYEKKVVYVYGKGVRAAYVPVSQSKVYWFVCFNSPSPGSKITDPSILRGESEKLLRGWPEELFGLIKLTPDESIVRSPLVDRWLWPGITPSPSNGNVVVVGDAWHPMTPNLGQGACCALEDAVVLSKKLAEAMRNGRHEGVREALDGYGKERWGRMFGLTVYSNLLGGVLQNENSVVCSLRDDVIVPKFASLKAMLRHTDVNLD